MNQRISQVALVVEDYDKAIEFYVGKLGFELVEDTKLSDVKRWVVVAPKGAGGTSLLLARAANQEQLTRVGNQTGGRVFLFLFTDDFERDFQRLKEQDIKIVRGPAKELYGTVAVFADLYGNLWDLIEPSAENRLITSGKG